MVELGCQDTNWVGGNDKVLDAILLREGLILATLGMKNVVMLATFLVGFGP